MKMMFVWWTRINSEIWMADEAGSVVSHTTATFFEEITVVNCDI